MQSSIGFKILCLVSITTVFVQAGRPDVCPVGYDTFDTLCLKLLPETSLTFWEAIVACDVIDGKLVEIVNAKEQEFVKKYLQLQESQTNVWMGATDLQGAYMFLTDRNKDSMISYTSWASGNPEKYTTTIPKHCTILSLSQGWKWANENCAVHYGALCSVRLRDPPIIGRRR